MACGYIAGAADTCGGAGATTERGVKLANIVEFACGLAGALPGREGGAEYVVGGGRAGSEWCGCMFGLFAIVDVYRARRSSRWPDYWDVAKVCETQ